MATNEIARELTIFEGSTLGNCLKVESFLGEGAFGFVTKCFDTKTNQTVAVKVNKSHPEIVRQAKLEIAILKQLRRLDPDTCHIVRWNGFFFDKERICLNFELLDQSLLTYLEEQGNVGLTVSELRPILYQLATALSHLSSMGIIHADLKPENVMLVNRHQKPLKVKLIDFGLARPVSASTQGVCVQSLWYRAPEVMLAIPFNEAIDMWSLGLVAVELATGYPLYPGNMDYDVLRFIIQTQGQPADSILHRGMGTEYFFQFDEGDNKQRWRFKTPEEFEYETGFQAEDTRNIRIECLDDLHQLIKMKTGHRDDRHLLVELIKSMLNLDANRRIKALQVLQHPFFESNLPESSCEEVSQQLFFWPITEPGNTKPRVQSLTSSVSVASEDSTNPENNGYIMEELLGEGGFGIVMKCRNTKTNQPVAVKVNKNNPEIVKQAKLEIAILKQLRRLDPDTCNIVKWNGFFFNKGDICLDFELLDQSLHDYMGEQGNHILPMTEVKSIIQQLATALSHLSSMGIIHADLKPDNVMVVNRHQKPLKVKLIDFGLAHPVFAATPGVCLQTTWYRAPEVMLAIPFNEAIDMWSLGLVAVELATGYPLYPGNMDYDVLRFIIQTQGQPADSILHCGMGTEYFFQFDDNGHQNWRFKTPEEFEYETGFHAEDTRYMRIKCLDDLEQVIKMKTGHRDNQHLLVELIKSMLHLDANQRIKPLQVLQHPFFAFNLHDSSCEETHTDIMNTIDENPQDSQQPFHWHITEPGNTELRIQSSTFSRSATLEKYKEDVSIQSDTNAENNGYIEKDFLWEGNCGSVTHCRNPQTNQDIKLLEILQQSAVDVFASSFLQSSCIETHNHILNTEDDNPQVSRQPFCWQITEPENTELRFQSSTSSVCATLEKNTEDVTNQSDTNPENVSYMEEDFIREANSGFVCKCQNTQGNQHIQPLEVLKHDVFASSLLQRSQADISTDTINTEDDNLQGREQPPCSQITEPRNIQCKVPSSPTSLEENKDKVNIQSGTSTKKGGCWRRFIRRVRKIFGLTSPST